MDKREWHYCQKPSVYGVHCDKCGGGNTDWSEYKAHIWCFSCEVDTKGTPGIFDGPIGVEVSRMMGISFDRIRLSDNKLLRMKIVVIDKTPISERELSDIDQTKIYAIKSNSDIYKAHRVTDRKWAFVYMHNSFSYANGEWNSLEELISSYVPKVYEFDSVVEFCKWVVGEKDNVS